MKRPIIIADNKIPCLNGILEPFANIVYKKGREISKADTQNADALLIRTRTKCDKALLQNTPVKFIASATIGYDHIDTKYCEENGIAWANAPGCNASSVEQYVVSALLFLAKENNFELKDKTLGVIGVGHVGSKVAKAASALGMRVLLNDPPRNRNENLDEFVDLGCLQQEADIVSFHVPLIRHGKDKTLDMANDQFFMNLKKGSILINTSRGEIIDECALEKAIDQKILLATVLDVWRNEPHLNINLLKKVSLATPHIAGYSADGKAKGTEMSVKALSKFFNLGLSEWKPENIPLPERPHIQIDCQNKSDQEIIWEAHKHTYNIISDAQNLRNNPEIFEAFRGNYPLRREAKAYRIELKGNFSLMIKNKLLKIGFHLK